MEIYFASDFHINSYIETHVGFSNTAKYKKFIDKSYTVDTELSFDLLPSSITLTSHLPSLTQIEIHVPNKYII